MQFAEITPKSPNYPELLREIHRPPKRLFVDGEIPLEPAVAIVGSRKHSRYGEDMTYKLTYDLARAGLVIVSGLAVGIDAVAHRAAIDAGGKTIAVIGCGLDVNNPAENKSLRDKIPRHGAVISEYELGTPGLSYNYPTRNRIVAGIARATIVTEAAAKSGALITAELANNFGRTVMALPGNVNSIYSAGTNYLLRKGATPITSSTDILADLGFPTEGELKTIKADSKEEALVMSLMMKGINTSEALIEAMKISASDFAQVISLMEITGKVKSLGAGHWTLGR